jgi:hypothetical protein
MAKTKRRKHRGGHPLLNTANANANLRYAPEERGLAALVGQARADLGTDLRVNAGVADTAARSARRSRPALRKIYNTAKTQVRTATADVNRAFSQGGLTPQNIFEVASARELGGDRSQLSVEAASAKRDAVRQEAMAHLGRIAADAASRGRYRDTVSQLNQRASELTGEKADFALSQLNALREASHKGDVTPSQRYTRATQLKVARIQQSGKAGKKKKKKTGSAETDAPPKGTTRATAVQIREMKDAVAKARSVVEQLRDPATIKALANPSDPSVKPLKINRNDRKQIGDLALRRSGVTQTALQLALDMAFNGYVRNNHVQYFRNTLGMSIDDLDLPRYTINRPKIKVRPT